ncbi:MAG: sporulation transcriptional regulator SpoIIID [Clostridia bacterium]|nr:sporulation transcriptional regulator SpoIIID [Clostridia bacterium]
MNNYNSKFRERSELFAEYIVENNATVRQTAHFFAISKSTVHKDLVTKLRYINPSLYSEVKKVLDTNKAERHLRGGEATKRKYKNI